MKLELFSTVFLLTLPGNLVSSCPVQPAGIRSGANRLDDRRNHDDQGPEEAAEDLMLPRGARVL